MGRVPDYLDDVGEVPDTGPSAPLGIKLYCLLAGLGSIYWIVVSLSLIGAGGSATIAGGILLAIALGYVVVLKGLWTLRPWAWTWAVVLFVLSAIGSLFRVDVLGLAISLLLLVYLVSKAGYYRGETGGPRDQPDDRRSPRA